MRAYIGIKYHEDYRNKEIVDKISAYIEQRNYESVCIVRDLNKEEKNTYNPYDLMKLTFEKIDSCDLIIIEFTEKGLGLGIEAGYAYAKKIPVFTIAKTGSEISETLLGISTKVFFYSSIEELENLIHQYL